MSVRFRPPAPRKSKGIGTLAYPFFYEKFFGQLPVGYFNLSPVIREKRRRIYTIREIIIQKLGNQPKNLLRIFFIS